jgi:hypothetical protein
VLEHRPANRVASQGFNRSRLPDGTEPVACRNGIRRLERTRRYVFSLPPSVSQNEIVAPPPASNRPRTPMGQRTVSMPHSARQHPLGFSNGKLPNRPVPTTFAPTVVAAVRGLCATGLVRAFREWTPRRLAFHRLGRRTTRQTAAMQRTVSSAPPLRLDVGDDIWVGFATADVCHARLTPPPAAAARSKPMKTCRPLPRATAPTGSGQRRGR